MEKEKAAMEEPQRKIWRKIWRRIRTKREKEKTAMEEPERKNRRRIRRKMEGPEWNIPREKASLDDDEVVLLNCMFNYVNFWNRVEQLLCVCVFFFYILAALGRI